ncbi:DUF4118 domain-containing protein [Rhodococcus sp. HNM0569]|uniref:sensor histidine kinase n=1 Tax=Rhodococcus sp. HNM0569 TaxID=2716340 RepID=UPI00146F8065|nr:DUF4118 domain-containing protein [Rhodococcus sp. HNM0569]NLU84861.1 sensor histidine kinase KdpD [Rhodococcus sp. HNM0569]
MNEPAGRRGRLRIYLGAAPGVGKTYAMLGEARRRLDRGTDVVVGVVDTHGRARTAEQLDGLDRVPPRRAEHRGAVLEDMDLDVVLARRPQVVLVDELAHTNAPGGRHAKRWQDVVELLDAGIDVLSTLNIQHLESLGDVVEQITGVLQQETVPDEFVRSAEQIQLVDSTPEALRSRLAHGNVYPAERIDAATNNYFRQGNLTALREIALLWLADHVDIALAKYRDDNAIHDMWEARERVVVAVTGGAETETLIRRASRTAAKSSAELLVVHIVRGDGLAGIPLARMTRIRELAGAVGASVHNVVGDDVPNTLLEFARATNATQLVVGTSRRSRVARMFDEGVAAAIVRRAGSVDVHMVTHEHTSSAPRLALFGRRHHRTLSWSAAFLVPVLGAALISLANRVLDTDSQGALFFVVVLAVALFGGIGPAVVAALFAGLLLNFFFTDPRYSLTIAEPTNFVTTVVLLVVAVAVAALVDDAARRAREVRIAARQAELLTLFAGAVLRGADVSALLENVRETYGQRAVAVARRDGRAVEVVAHAGPKPPVSPEASDTSCVVDDVYALLLEGPPLPAHERTVLNAVAAQAVALIRQQALARDAATASALAETDRLRRLLLSAVSHDLRTPLAAAKAAVSSLRSTDVEFSPEDTTELLATVEESTDQLTALVENLLDYSRITAGVVSPTLGPVYVEEIVHRVLLGVSAGGPRLRGLVRDNVKVADVDVVVLADGGLLERALANLVDNALKYAPGSLVTIAAATVAGDRVTITVADHGPGMDPDAPRSTRAFSTGDRDNTTGAGLGLIVVGGFVEAMGGAVATRQTAGGGTTMEVTLAVPGKEQP